MYMSLRALESVSWLTCRETQLPHTYSGMDQALTMVTKSTIKIPDEHVHVDPQLLFQTLVTFGIRNDDLKNVFDHEHAGRLIHQAIGDVDTLIVQPALTSTDKQ